MKRLKYRHLFYGKIIPIVLSIFGVFFVMTPILDTIKNKRGYIYHMIGSVALILLTLAVDYAVIHRLKPDEKKKIAEASPLKWKKFPDRFKKKFRIDKKEALIYMANLIGLELIAALIVMIAGGVTAMLVSLEILLPATLICLATYAVWEHIWANMNDSAIYTRIEVDHSFEGEMARGGRRKFIVFYLPDGKYVLETYGYTPKNIIVIKYKRFIRWEDADIFF
ncbi:MAG: hypothetical protein K2N27_08520 [Ruminococcus sp.]|nr:hypothetical protein [Ruminococcus sp.]